MQDWRFQRGYATPTAERVVADGASDDPTGPRGRCRREGLHCAVARRRDQEQGEGEDREGGSLAAGAREATHHHLRALGTDEAVPRETN